MTGKEKIIITAVSLVFVVIAALIGGWSKSMDTQLMLQQQHLALLERLIVDQQKSHTSLDLCSVVQISFVQAFGCDASCTGGGPVMSRHGRHNFETGNGQETRAPVGGSKYKCIGRPGGDLHPFHAVESMPSPKHHRLENRLSAAASERASIGREPDDQASNGADVSHHSEGDKRGGGRAGPAGQHSAPGKRAVSRALTGSDPKTRAIVEASGHPRLRPGLEPMRLLWELLRFDLEDWDVEEDGDEFVVAIVLNPWMEWRWLGEGRWEVSWLSRRTLVDRPRQIKPVLCEAYPAVSWNRRPDPAW